MTTNQFRKAAKNEKKSSRTRALLMDAAVSVFAKKGVDTSSVNDIIAASNVSHGTFYYHFKNKDEIVDAVGRSITASIVNQVEQEISQVEIGMERVALATTIFIRLASKEPDWGGMIVEALSDMGPLQDGISRGIREDVQSGVADGSFKVKLNDLLFQSALSISAVTLRSCIQGQMKVSRGGFEASTFTLRLLGVRNDIAESLPKDVWKKYIAKTRKSLVLNLPGSFSEE